MEWLKLYSRQFLCDCRLSQVLAFGQLTVPERGVVVVTWPFLEFTAHEISSERLKLQISNFVRLQVMSNVSLRTVDRPWKGRGTGHVIYFRFLRSLNSFGLAEDRIVKFCARVGPRSISKADEYKIATRKWVDAWVASNGSASLISLPPF